MTAGRCIKTDADRSGYDRI